MTSFLRLCCCCCDSGRSWSTTSLTTSKKNTSFYRRERLIAPVFGLEGVGKSTLVARLRGGNSYVLLYINVGRFILLSIYISNHLTVAQPHSLYVHFIAIIKHLFSKHVNKVITKVAHIACGFPLQTIHDHHYCKFLVPRGYVTQAIPVRHHFDGSYQSWFSARYH